MYNRSTKFYEIVGAIFEKMKLLNFFLCELLLILRVDRKRKRERERERERERKRELEIFAKGPYISYLNEIGQLA